MESLSSPRIWFISPSAKADMNSPLQTCIPLVSKGKRQGEEQAKKKNQGKSWGCLGQVAHYK